MWHVSITSSYMLLTVPVPFVSHWSVLLLTIFAVLSLSHLLPTLQLQMEPTLHMAMRHIAFAWIPHCCESVAYCSSSESVIIIASLSLVLDAFDGLSWDATTELLIIWFVICDLGSNNIYECYVRWHSCYLAYRSFKIKMHTYV